MVATDEDTVIAVDVVPGQASDAPLLEPMLEATCQRLPVVDELVGDKAFDGMPNTTLIPATAEAEQKAFGIAQWPESAGSRTRRWRRS